MNSCYTPPRSWRFYISAILAALLYLSFYISGQTAAVGLTGPEVSATQQNPLAEADALDRRAQELQQQGRYDDALPLAERALRLREENLDPDNLVIAISLERLATLVRIKGDFDRAESLLQRVLKIREKFLGPNDFQVAVALNAIAVLQEAKGEYGRAVETMSRSLAIREQLFRNDPAMVSALSNLAVFYQNLGRFEEAEGTLLRALRILENVSATSDPNSRNSADSINQLGFVLNNLASLYQETGDYITAEKYFLRSLELRERILGKDHALTALTQSNLAMLYHVKGDFERAEVMLLRSLEIVRKAHNNPENVDVVTIMSNLADVYRAKGDQARAEQMLGQVLEIRERIYLGEHPDIAKSLSNLAVVYEEKGDHERASQLMQRALSMYERLLGPEHPDVAHMMNNFGMLYKAQGAYPLAEKSLTRSLEIRRKVLSEKHPDVAVSLYNLAALHESRGNTKQAIEYMASGDAIREHNLALILATGSERQKQLYLATLTGEAFQTVSCQINSAATNRDAERLALTTVLRRKGRVLDALTDQFNSLRQRATPEDRQLLDQLADKQSQLANLRLASIANNLSSTEDRLAKDQRLTSQLENLQAEISRRSAEFRVETQPVTIEAVQQALPADAALVEIFAYRPFDPRAATIRTRFGAARYVAYVLKRGSVNFVELGPMAPIDKSADQFVNAISNPANLNTKETGRALDEILARPIRSLLGNVRNVLISPDGELNLVPFAALVDEHGKYLVEKYHITYLTSGRDLLRLNVPRQGREAPIVIANPAFNLASPGAESTVATGELKGEMIAGPRKTSRRRSGNMNTKWRQLPGTKEEADYLAKLLPKARVLTGRNATEGALKQVAGPRLLHVATHGFFLSDEPSNQVAKVVGMGENPLLRSGLILAGANNFRGGGDEDGVLTALEAAGLNLWGTQLVVLSACDTGVGDVRSGEGVYGLRRALVLAGTESQVMTLWKVDDQSTSEIITEYYRRLLAGEARSEALRNVQLDFVRRKTREHPFYWASFILNGDWRRIRVEG